jgi:monoamine oxidase
MMISDKRVIIIGGGLSGLILSYLLQRKNLKTTILEAAPRLGGRIQTVKGKLGTPMELGATWFADKHVHFSSLITELGLNKFPQYSKGKALFQTKSFEPPQEFLIPEAEQPSYRVRGGTQAVIDALEEKLKGHDIHLNKKVIAVHEADQGVVIETADGSRLEAELVVICMPPQLAGEQIEFTPDLPTEIRSILPTVQTWMAGAIKFTLEYERPFWRNKGFSGMLYSHADIVVEMYDHTNFEEDKFGFTGFLNGGASRYSQEVRKENVLRQLSELLGEEARQPLVYFDKVWNDAFIIEGNQLIGRPHQNNGHPLLQKSYMNGKLFFCGTETASEFPGYMEGAVEAAVRVAERIL